MGGVGMPAALKLEWFGRVLHEFFGHRAYQVGSSLKSTEWRDVDVRMILPDKDFDALFGELTRPRCINLKWNAACLAFAALGREITGLPIDFQVDRQTEANEEYPGARSALGLNLELGELTPERSQEIESLVRERYEAAPSPSTNSGGEE